MTYMLPRPVWSDDRSEIVLDGSGFEADYHALEDFLSEDSVTQLSVWLIKGINLDRHIRLDDRTVLRRLKPLEIEDCLKSGLIVPRHQEILFPESPLEGPPVGLVFSRTEPKAFDLEPMETDLDDFNRRILEKQNVVENLLTCAALTNLPHLSVSNMRAESHSWDGRLSEFLPGGGASIKFSLVGGVRSDAITNSTARLLTRYWNWLSRQRENTNLTFASRRLGYANERVRVEDLLLDTMIAAESLYLDRSDNTELSFRLAVRAAVWGDPAKLGATRHEIYDFMKAAYEARSRIAHGGEPRPSRLRFKGNTIGLEQFSNILGDIVRTGLVKAINYAERNSASNFEPDWDQMIIK